jgi:hypothetical protein
MLRLLHLQVVESPQENALRLDATQMRQGDDMSMSNVVLFWLHYGDKYQQIHHILYIPAPVLLKARCYFSLFAWLRDQAVLPFCREQVKWSCQSSQRQVTNMILPVRAFCVRL